MANSMWKMFARYWAMLAAWACKAPLACALIATVFLLDACGGGAGSSTSTSGGGDTLTVAMTLPSGVASNRFPIGSTINLKATLLAGGNSSDPIANATITFSTNSAIATVGLPSGATLSNSSGVANTTLLGIAQGVDTLKVTAQYTNSAGTSQTLTTTMSYEVLQATVSQPTMQLSISPSQTITSGSQATVTATLTDASGSAVPNALVTFSANNNIATFNPSSGTALTNAQGVASIGIVGTSALGADVIKATATTPSVSGVSTSVTASLNYQVVAAGSGASPTLSLALSLNGVAITVLPSGQDGTLSAVFTDATGAPVSNALVTFTIPTTGSSGTANSLVSLSSATALTDSTGRASTSVLGVSSSTAGVVTVNATAVSGSITATSSLSFQYQPPTPNISSLTVSMPSGSTSIPASTAVNVMATLVDANTGEAFQGALTVNFSSACVQAGTATIQASAANIDGTATATYTPQGCVGSDVITASITSLGQTRTLSKTVTIAAASPSSLVFESATPSVLGIQGSSSDVSGSVVFELQDQSGNPVAGQTVNFSLNTSIGGIVLSTPSGVTDANGQVSATVTAGTIGTPLTVTATLASNSAIWAQSRGMYISTKLPHENGLSLSSNILNPEFYDIDGQSVTLTVHASDRFGLPVPDNTVINFRTEGGIGVIQDASNSKAPVGGCLTTLSTCSVTLTSSGNRGAMTHAGRQAIIAYAVGEDSFVDNNGNGIFDSGDTFPPPGPYLAGDPYIDVAEVGSFQSGDEFVDFNNSGSYYNGGGLYSGIDCKYTGKCATSSSRLVYQQLVLVWAGSSAKIAVSGSGVTGSGASTLITVPPCGSVTFTLKVTDENGQTMPYQTTIGLTATPSSLSPSSTNFSVTNTNDFSSSASPNYVPPVTYPITLSGTGTTDPTSGACTPPTPSTGSLAITVLTPKNIQTLASFNIQD